MSGGSGVKDVAALAGVSLGTVSNVLNRPHLVRPATRARVEAAIAELGFVRNESARQLRAGRSRTVAYVVLDMGNPFFTDVARGVEEVAREHGLALYLCTSNEDPGREADYLELLREQRVRGVLVTPAGEPDNPRLAALPALGIPVVIVDQPSAGADYCAVAVDDVEGGRLAVTHLLERGHRRIAYVGGPTSVPQVRDRHRGALAAVREAGLDADALTVVETGGLNVTEGRAAGQRLAGLPAARRPSAAFCANDLLALGLLQEMTTLGVAVPDGMAIVGYDDIEFAGAAAVPLTSVRQPRHLIGRTAMELLLAESEADDEGRAAHRHQQVEFTPELVVRASSIGRARDRDATG